MMQQLTIIRSRSSLARSSPDPLQHLARDSATFEEIGQTIECLQELQASKQTEQESQDTS